MHCSGSHSNPAQIGLSRDELKRSDNGKQVNLRNQAIYTQNPVKECNSDFETVTG
jgi:hypothetical protein